MPETAAYGLSLGDRACLALVASRTCPAMTADRCRAEIGLGIAVKLIR